MRTEDILKKIKNNENVIISIVGQQGHGMSYWALQIGEMLSVMDK